MATVNDDLFDALVRHQIGLTRLSSGTAQNIIARLNNYDKRIVDILLGLNASSSKTAVNKALREIRQVNITAYLAVEKDLTKAMKDLAISEVEHQAKTLSANLPKDARAQIDAKTPTKKSLREMVDGEAINGALPEEHINGMEIGRYNRMRDLIRREMAAGGTDAAVQAAIMAGIKGTAAADYKDGLLGFSRRSAEQVTKTVSNGIAQMARSQFVEQNDNIFDGVQWVSILDNKTSDICQSLDGSVFPVDEGPRPPAHPNCRSQVVPIVKDWEAMGLSDLGPGTREAMDGEVPETITYNEWLKGQSADVQNEILGPTRADIFRQGDITLDRFIDDNGRRWTLAELEEQGIL